MEQSLTANNFIPERGIILQVVGNASYEGCYSEQKVRVTLALAVNVTDSTQVVQANTPVVSCNTPYHYRLKMVCWRSATF